MNNALLASRIDENSTSAQALAKTLLLVLEDSTADASDYDRDI